MKASTCPSCGIWLRIVTIGPKGKTIKENHRHYDHCEAEAKPLTKEE